MYSKQELGEANIQVYDCIRESSGRGINILTKSHILKLWGEYLEKCSDTPVSIIEFCKEKGLDYENIKTKFAQLKEKATPLKALLDQAIKERQSAQTLVLAAYAIAPRLRPTIFWDKYNARSYTPINEDAPPYIPYGGAEPPRCKCMEPDVVSTKPSYTPILTPTLEDFTQDLFPPIIPKEDALVEFQSQEELESQVENEIVLSKHSQRMQWDFGED